MSKIFCPVCGGAVSYHASYYKKLNGKPLKIIRVRCRNKACSKTHAVIPSFSTPGCSTGTAELDSFIRNRAAGKTIDQAGQVFCDAGMSPDYPESIHRRLKKYCNRIRTIFSSLVADLPDIPTDYARLIRALAENLTGDSHKPASVLNLHSCMFGCNPVLFSRKNILIFQQNNSAPHFSHNPPFRPPP